MKIKDLQLYKYDSNTSSILCKFVNSLIPIIPSLSNKHIFI